jgi:hypothetical protein
MSNVNPALELLAIRKKSPGLGRGGLGGFGWVGRRSIATSNETPSMKIHGFVA